MIVKTEEKWKKYYDNIDLYDRLNYKVNGVKYKKTGGFYSNLAIDAKINTGELSIGYNINGEIDFDTIGRIDHGFKVDIVTGDYNFWREYYISVHQFSEKGGKRDHFDLFGGVNFYKEYKKYTFLAGIEVGGYHYLSNRIQYLAGPFSIFKLGIFKNLEKKNYSMLILSGGIYYFKNENFRYCPDASFGISNQYIDLGTILKKGFKLLKKLELSIVFNYKYLYWLQINSWRFEGDIFSKRRVEHNLKSNIVLSYYLFKFFKINFDYTHIITSSSIGEKKDDYTDYNLNQQIIGIGLEMEF